jgi:hypothetical protein
MAKESGKGPHYVLTPGKLMTGPDIFANGLPGNPSAPKMRGDAKAPGSSHYPMGATNAKNSGPFKAFGIRGSNENGKGGKGGLGD